MKIVRIHLRKVRSHPFIPTEFLCCINSSSLQYLPTLNPLTHVEWGRECATLVSSSEGFGRQVRGRYKPKLFQHKEKSAIEGSVYTCEWIAFKHHDLTQWSLPGAIARKLDILYWAEQNLLLSFRSQNPGPGAKELSSVTFQFILYWGQGATDNWTHSSFGDRMMLFNIQPDSWCAVQSEWAHSLITEECRIIGSHILNQALHLFFLEI